MKKEVERKYIDKLWRKMSHALQNYIKTQSVDDMHRFRVQVKKLRAFITLAESADSKVNLKQIIKPVKQLFSKAGEIRTADLNIEISKSNAADPRLLAQQIVQRDVAIRAFKPYAKKQLCKLKFIKKRLHKSLKPISNLHINLYYLESLKQLSDQFDNLAFNESLHDSRKQLKVLLYDHKIAARVLSLPVNTDYIDKVQEAIGNWHDNEDAKQLFKKEQLPLTGINQKDLKLQALIKQVVNNLYHKATTVVDVPLPQIS